MQTATGGEYFRAKLFLRDQCFRAEMFLRDLCFRAESSCSAKKSRRSESLRRQVDHFSSLSIIITWTGPS